MKKSFFVGSLLLLTAGLGLKPIATQTIAKQVVTQTQPSIAPAPQPKVELLSAGAQPQQVLRFQPAVNTIETATMIQIVTMTLNTATEMSIPEMSTPPSIKRPLPVVRMETLMKMETVVTQIDSNGDVHYKFRYSDAHLTEDSSIFAMPLDSTRAQLEKLVGLNGYFVMDDQGHTKSMSLSIPKGVDAATRQMLEQSFQSLEQIFAPLPLQAVGVGAKWKTLMPSKIYGMTIDLARTYELVSLKDGVATLRLGVKQQAQSQKLAIPGIPKGASSTLNITGRGEFKVRLDRLLPSVATLSTTSAAQIQVADPKTSKLMTTATKTQLEMMLQSK